MNTPPSGSDAVLGILVSMVNNGTISQMGVTLTGPGYVLSGKMVSTSDWLNTVAQTIASATGEQLGEGLSAYFTKMRELITEDDDQPESALPPPRYINLIGARLLSGSSLHWQEMAVAWRLRLDQVSGWTVGELS